MRKGCTFCVRKHLSQASVLLDESVLGYPHHRWLAVGHLAEAESEVFELHPEFASKIRDVRIKLMHTIENPIIENLLIEFLELIGEPVKFSPLNSKEFSNETKLQTKKQK